jgi:protocatechuate 3,4-dioxygenase beta subunit
MRSPSSSAIAGFSRRRVIAAFLAALPSIYFGTLAQAAVTRRPTPAQTEGPFYPVVLPQDSDNDLLRNGDQSYNEGRSVWLEGTVTDLAGLPVANAVVEIWQCDNAGHYHHPGDGGKADPRFQGFGRATVDDNGRYRFRTIRPVSYGTRAPHIHVKVKRGVRELLTTQVYVAGDPDNAHDALWRNLIPVDRDALTVAFVPQAGGFSAAFPIVVALG